jgi:hypothetical protein
MHPGVWAGNTEYVRGQEDWNPNPRTAPLSVYRLERTAGSPGTEALDQNRIVRL